MNEMKDVSVFVPADIGLGGSGSSISFRRGFNFLNILFIFMGALEWLLSPFETYQNRKKYKRNLAKAAEYRKRNEEENLAKGLNRDGSYTRNFAAGTTLYEALAQLGLKPGLEMRRHGERSLILAHGYKTLGELDALRKADPPVDHIAGAIISCQMVNW